MIFVAESLNFSAYVLYVDKHAVIADGHGAAGNGHAVFGISSGFKFLIFFLKVGGKSVGAETIRIRVVPLVLQSL